MENLKNYIIEASNKTVKDAIQNLYDEEGDLTLIRDCMEWLDELDWKTKTKNEYAKYISNVNKVVSELYAKRVYCDCMVAMASIGRNKTIDILKDIAGESELSDFGINLL